MNIRRLLLAGAGVAAAIMLAIPGTALAASPAAAQQHGAARQLVAPAGQAIPAPPTGRVTGGFVPYSRLSSMPASFQQTTLRNIADLPASVRGAQVKELPSSLRMKVPDVAAAPDSASGCNQNVCISVSGSGTYVSNWNTQAFGNVGCSHALYLVDGASWLESLAICPSSSAQGVYYFNLNYDGDFGEETTLCNNWVSNPINGFPCETVE